MDGWIVGWKVGWIGGWKIGWMVVILDFFLCNDERQKYRRKKNYHEQSKTLNKFSYISESHEQNIIDWQGYSNMRWGELWRMQHQFNTYAQSGNEALKLKLNSGRTRLESTTTSVEGRLGTASCMQHDNLKKLDTADQPRCVAIVNIDCVVTTY